MLGILVRGVVRVVGCVLVRGLGARLLAGARSNAPSAHAAAAPQCIVQNAHAL